MLHVTQNAHALTHAHEIATKQRHNKQSFSLSHTIVASYGSQRTRKQAKEAPEHPLETDQQRRVRLHEETELEGEQSQRNREKQD